MTTPAPGTLNAIAYNRELTQVGPMPIKNELVDGVLTLHYDPYNADNLVCPICYQKITRVRLHGVTLYTMDLNYLERRIVPGIPTARLVAQNVRAIENAPCGHKVEPYYRNWTNAYHWPSTREGDQWPPPPEYWARPKYP